MKSIQLITLYLIVLNGSNSFLIENNTQEMLFFELKKFSTVWFSQNGQLENLELFYHWKDLQKKVVEIKFEWDRIGGIDTVLDRIEGIPLYRVNRINFNFKMKIERKQRN